MANDNARNCPRYPLDRRCVRTPVCGDEALCETPAAGEAEDCSGAVRAAPEDAQPTPRNPFGTAFR